ncbi:hypothetical protein B0P06_000552 [Clostridium saccharoperbutylacetonicum]|uniref:Uncharacterized protein n=1 Tax=Clostridium saccharoperbutylacetonicum N1-4(HMT) TaxID=931276 RepID=M1LR31_9CLOT|nr:hypothetical protein [Clostridium saccharoperbutylacetonicum]AGF55360.1 hypothetical protein Cspa_c15900 [Clostridium saccharoperbutylacetonicum N1-4(HMT)]NRT63927.1 hypothetical protein [Clostridium saccharoperbutylacetonicum]NSB27294.1 hypothetical protein [Clostridium saccharoperbutylacetonicum]NSB40781.1 hypothetical protein [Clostridium saccharoperbutylacetonicum]
MEILNEIEHKYLGNICCVADEDGNPFEWSKVKSITIFNRNYESVKISFNFFCFNKYFEVNEVFEDIAENVDKSIVENYKLFIDDKKEIEEIFFEWFKRDVECILEDKESMSNKENIYALIKIVEVRIFTDGYAVIFETPWHDELLGIEKKVFEDGAEDISIQLESDIDVVEMDYE